MKMTCIWRQSAKQNWSLKANGWGPNFLNKNVPICWCRKRISPVIKMKQQHYYSRQVPKYPGKLPCKLTSWECLTYQVLAHWQETQKIQTESTLLLLTLSPTWQPERICSVLLLRDKLGSMSGRLMKADFGSREHFLKIRWSNDEGDQREAPEHPFGMQLLVSFFSLLM